MAKGNLFQGMARGKVGDVVFSRANGEQISRVRNRHPKNPRSNGQLFQRAIMATIVQAYAAGKAIFDHSFQGYAVGAQNQRKFISENAKMLRETIAADINTPIATKDQKGRVIAPSVSMPVPNTYIIAKGTYSQNLFTVGAGTFKIAKPQEGETIAAYATRLGLIAGDIYTIVAFAVRKETVYKSNLWEDVLASQNGCDFVFIRLTVKENLTATTPAQDYGEIFDVEVSSPLCATKETIETWGLVEEGTISWLLKNYENHTRTGAIGIIRSRKDQDLRSESQMILNYGTTAEDMFGIASDYLLDTWRAGTSSIGDSDLILEGGGL